MAQKVWMITGASRGLGAEIAKAALAAGEKVIATGRGKDGLKFSSDQDALFPVEMDRVLGCQRGVELAKDNANH